jgi:predicted branched-subunit amino acid permease
MTRSPLRTGFLDIAPLGAPAIPFGLVLGIAIAESPINNFLGWSSSWIIFAGAAQLTLITLLAGTTVVGAIAAALIVNSRHFMYSVAMAERFADQPRWFRWLGPYTLIDQIFAIAMTRLDTEPGWFRKYYLTASATMWGMWQIAVGTGVVVGGAFPAEWRLDFAVPILFVTLVVLGLTRRPAVVAAAVGFLSAALAGPLPNRSSILVGALVGVIVGTLVEPHEEESAS